MAGEVSVEDRSKRTEYVKPQFGERGEGLRECDFESSVKNDGNDVEVNGETDDEVMEDGETVRLASPGEVFDGEQRSEDVRSLSRLRSVGSQ